MRIYYFVFSILLPGISIAQAQRTPLLQAGPMVGYSDFREVQLWVQTRATASVQFEYWVKASPGTKRKTVTVETRAEDAFVAKLLADQVEPGNVYGYRLMLNGRPVVLNYPLEFKTPSLWRKSKTPPNFTVAMGSCVFINDSLYDDRPDLYGGEYFIFESIHKKRPDLMLWLGDNLYLREADWNTKTGIQYRYTQTRSILEMQPLLASTHNYACWDDHDFGPNDSDRSFVHKDLTLDAFKLFWGNPSYGLPGLPGITTQFTWGDVDFFILDNRYYRAPQNRQSGERTMLGREQLDWLVDALASSIATYKIVVTGGLVLSTSSNVKNQNYISNYAEERTHLLKRIEEENLKNVIFISGDKHFSELSHMVNAKGNSVYDFTVSPLTSKANTRKDVNLYRVEHSLIQERNFGMLEFSGSLEARALTFSLFNSKGELLWTQKIIKQ